MLVYADIWIDGFHAGFDFVQLVSGSRTEDDGGDAGIGVLQCDRAADATTGASDEYDL